MRVGKILEVTFEEQDEVFVPVEEPIPVPQEEPEEEKEEEVVK